MQLKYERKMIIRTIDVVVVGELLLYFQIFVGSTLIVDFPRAGAAAGESWTHFNNYH